MKLNWSIFRVIAIAVIGVLGLGSAYAQSTNSGDIRGTVTDSTGALLPGVTVTVTNNNTGVTKTLVTNDAGLYDTSSIVVGNYKLTFEKTGFAKFERSSVTLQVGTSTVNAALKVGSTTQEVVVNTDIPLLTTETGEQSTTLEAKAMAALPNVGQTWENFAILIPGSSGTTGGSQGSTNPGQEISANGNLPYSNVLADGTTSTLSHSANADTTVFEDVAEVQISTSAFSAQYGIGGIIFNQISKGGTSQFHGSAYEYMKNDDFNAKSYLFYGNPATIPPLRYNNFGGTIGGPILKKKAFFFFNYDQTIQHGSSSGTNSIPTVQVMAGDFTGQPLIYDPTTQTIAHDSAGNPYPVRQSFLSEYGTNAVPVALQDKVAQNFQKFYPTPSSHISGGQFLPGNNNNGIIQNNFYAQIASNNPYRKYFGRLDYDITEHNRFTASVTTRDNPAFFPSTVAACPIGCQNGDVESYNSQVSDVWTINSNMINEARFGYTYQGNFYTDAALGKGYASALGWQAAKADDFPAIQFITNYPYAWIDPSANAVYKEHVFDPSDVVTMIRGKHILHFGGEVQFARDDSTAWGNTNAGTYQFSGQYTQNWTVNPGTGKASPNGASGADYADFLLGEAQNWNASVSPEYGARLKSPQMFVQDDYKIRPNLTINLGVRYQIRHGWSEIHGNEAVFDPTVMNPATNTLGAYWYGSTKANGRGSLEDTTFSTVLPRFGFAYLPTPSMTIRGGFGLYAYNLSLDTYGGGMGAAVSSSGSIADQTNGLNPITILGGTGTNFQTGNPLPYSAASTNPTRFNGQNVTYTQFHTPDPKIYQWNLSTQKEIGTNMEFEIAYVASHGFNLNFPTDLNQVPVQDLSSNDQAFRPYAQYGGISGSTNNGISNYNSLQVTVQRRLSSGLAFNFNYTWSHFLDDADSSSWGSRAGPQPYQIASNPGVNYSNSNFDVRSAFKGNAVYQLPFGMGKRYLNHNYLLDKLVGGYELSTTVQLTSGNPFTVTTSANSYAHAGSVFPNYSGIATRPTHGRSIQEWYNPAAFTLPANGTFGNVRRNSLYGPGIELVNLSAGKYFDIYKNVKLQIRGDATNAFNHPSFGFPQTNLSTGSLTPGQAYPENLFGGKQINGNLQGGGRVVQLGARLQF
ncbi:MAG TPA: TonB-dependent receptor [Acidobacteriaceae bacterium]